MRARAFTLIFCLCLLVGLSACGNKGPLTLPEDEDKQAKTTST